MYSFKNENSDSISNPPEFNKKASSNFGYLKPKRDINQENYPNFEKTFKSNYINDSGKWTIKAVDDGLVEFDDYIGDIENVTDEHPSYNNKVFKISKATQNDYDSSLTEQFANYDKYAAAYENKIKNAYETSKEKVLH